MNSRHEQRLAEFMVHGPFRLPTTGRAASRELDRDAFSGFWKHTTLPELSRKVGCYVFAMRVGKSYRPYYVGQTCADFSRECFNRRNVDAYNQVLAQHGKSCVPILFLVSTRSRKIKPSLISDIETFFIQLGADRNPHFLNVKGKRSPRWRIAGVIRARGGKRSRAAREFRKTFDL